MAEGSEQLVTTAFVLFEGQRARAKEMAKAYRLPSMSYVIREALQLGLDAFEAREQMRAAITAGRN